MNPIEDTYPTVRTAEHHFFSIPAIENSSLPYMRFKLSIIGVTNYAGYRIVYVGYFIF